jgi:BlaI family penicillinase repressor
MRKLPRISDAEWEVMRIVWERSPVAAGDVVRELSPRTGWNHRTIRTMIARLSRKGAISVKEIGGRHLYSPRVRRDACVRSEGRSFLSRVFSGDTASLLLHYVEECDLTKSELAALRRELERKIERSEEE